MPVTTKSTSGLNAGSSATSGSGATNYAVAEHLSDLVAVMHQWLPPRERFPEHVIQTPDGRWALRLPDVGKTAAKSTDEFVHLWHQAAPGRILDVVSGLIEPAGQRQLLSPASVPAGATSTPNERFRRQPPSFLPPKPTAMPTFSPHAMMGKRNPCWTC